MDFATGLVGRSEELDRFSHLLSGRGGQARVALLIGDAGIGKSRLVWESAAAGEAMGVRVVVGACLPMTDALPLLPVTEALREFSKKVPRLFAESLAHAPPYVRKEIAGLLPERGPATEDGDSSSQPGEGWQRERRFTAVRELLALMASRSPLAIVIEDLHWADRTTLDLLTFLTSGGRGGPIPVAVSCRTDEPTMQVAVRDWLNAMRVVPGVMEVRLPPLSHVQSVELARALAGGSASGDALDSLCQRAEGNPFFTEQLIAAQMAVPQGSAVKRTTIPLGLAALLTARARGTSIEARRVLSALSVAGRPVPDSQLEAVGEISPEELVDALEELTETMLVSRDERGWHRARHALLAEAVAADLLPARRRRLHARFAEVISQEGDPSSAAEVAAHWAAAERPDEELLWTVRAARFAEDLYAFTEARRHWGRVIELCGPQDSNPPGMRLAQVYLHAIDGAEAVGDAEAASDLTEQAIVRVASEGETADLGDLMVAAASYRVRQSVDEAVQAAREAVRIFSSLPASPQRAEALCRCGGVLMKRPDYEEEAVKLFNDALEMARQCRSLHPHVNSLLRLCEWETARGDPLRGEELLAEAAQLSRDIPDGQMVASVGTYQTDLLLRTGRLAEAASSGMKALRRAQSLGRGGAFEAVVVAANVCEALLGLGRVAEAAALIAPLTPAAPSPGDWPTQLLRAEVESANGHLDEAWARLQAIRTALSATRREVYLPTHYVEIEQRVIEVALWRRRPEDVADAVDVVASLGPFNNDTSRLSGRLFTAAMRAQADLAALARSRRRGRDLAQALAGGDRLLDIFDSLPEQPHRAHRHVATADAERATWNAESARLRSQNDPDIWAEAANAWESAGRPHRLAYCLWHQAELLLAEGRGAEAPLILRRAAEAASGMNPLLSRITGLASRARIAINPAESPSQTPGARPYGLTSREISVLSLLTQGSTNRQIATSLYISEKTVSVHVSNILRKLDVTSRLQAATRAEREDLIG